MSCQVKVVQGILQGKKCKTYYGKTYYSFEGIPYAKPPVGELRFKAPENPESWNGIRDATKPGNRCSQLNPYINTALQGSEDCLYLNVYTPILPQEKIKKLPVIFFVHGGRLIFGYGDYYTPDYLIKHDVIIVTINYRLHILGFLCLNIPEVPGNAGLKDTIMALKWVNKNIGFFNGDAGNVTVMGESAGAGVVGSYLTSKMADGLFHKIISQSGASISDLYMVEGEDTVEKATLVASNLGQDIKDPRSLYEFLLTVPVDDLVVAFSAAEMSRPPSIINAFFLPVVERKFDGVEQFFDEYPRRNVMKNNFKKMPILVVMNSHEAGLFLQRDGDGNVVFERDFIYFLPRYLNVKKGDKRLAEIEKKIRQFYFQNKDIDNTTKEEYIDMLSDRYFNFDIMKKVETFATSSDVYFCKFQYSGNMNTRVMKSIGMTGASHGDVIQYQFYRKRKHEKCTEKDIKIVEMISEAWCNFAKNGQPSWTNQETKWLPYTIADKQTLIIDDKIELLKNPDFNRFKFWQNIVGESSISKL